jgi:hypothetical protein
MHAKMTRDRKKNFIATIEKTIGDLESNNARMKEVLSRVVQTHFKGADSVSTPVKSTVCPVTPECSSLASPTYEIPPLHTEGSELQPLLKKFRKDYAVFSA